VNSRLIFSFKVSDFSFKVKKTNFHSCCSFNNSMNCLADATRCSAVKGTVYPARNSKRRSSESARACSRSPCTLSRTQRHALNAHCERSSSSNLPVYLPVSTQYFSRLAMPWAVVTADISLTSTKVRDLLLYFYSLAARLPTGSSNCCSFSMILRGEYRSEILTEGNCSIVAR
jgi:hypothetical protein